LTPRGAPCYTLGVHSYTMGVESTVTLAGRTQLGRQSSIRLTMHRLSRFAALHAVLGCLLSVPGYAQTDTAAAPGDRVTAASKDLAEWIPAALPRETYPVGPGDVLAINVQGKADLNYHVRPVMQPGENPDELSVTPGGEIYLPLVGELRVAGKTVLEIEDLIRAELGKYIKTFDVSVSVSKVRTLNVWISGEVSNPGPQILPAVSTVSLAALQAGIKPTGSTRRITLIRGGDRQTIDLYKMAVTGSVGGDVPLEPGDSIHIPPVTDYVEVGGEVTRPGRYEMVGLSADSGGFRIRDLVGLALGTLPSAALDKASVERIGEDSKKKAINVDLRDSASPADMNMPLEPGDTLVIPSIAAFQPMIRLIGEFKGDGVYQRVLVTAGSAAEYAESVQNKSGIYFLKQGQTVLDVITATGGVTPQADLKRARIERHENGAARAIPVDLERLLIAGDKTADVALVNGDSLVLPAVADKVHVFGEVVKPGSYVYSPNRRLLDYLGDAGGPLNIAKLTEVSVVRGASDKPEIIRLNARNAMRGTSTSGNPVLEPGDIVYVPSKFISGWRDAVQLVFTSLSLASLLNRR